MGFSDEELLFFLVVLVSSSIVPFFCVLIVRGFFPFLVSVDLLFGLSNSLLGVKFQVKWGCFGVMEMYFDYFASSKIRLNSRKLLIRVFILFI